MKQYIDGIKEHSGWCVTNPYKDDYVQIITRYDYTGGIQEVSRKLIKVKHIPIFTTIPSTPNYLAGSDGTIIRLPKVITRGKFTHNKKGGIAMPTINTDYIGVSIDGKTRYVHRIIAEAFIYNPDNKPCVNHKDGNKHNNKASNLEWVTHLENAVHATNTGLLHKVTKLTDDEVKRVRQLYKDGLKIHEIQHLYDKVSRSQIRLIVNETSRRYVK